jgi:hypothetical protein
MVTPHVFPRLTQIHAHATCCPACGGHHFARAHAHGPIERFILPIVQIRPYRCTDCDDRFYSRRASGLKSKRDRKRT